MSTAFEWRESADLERERPNVARPRRVAPPDTTTETPRPASALRRTNASGAVGAGLRQRLNRARFLAAAIVALSILGLLYLTQISHVARYGYLLSDLQREQDRVERENQLLEYSITSARGLSKVEDLAERSYGMQPIVAAKATAAASTATTGAKGAPQARFVTVQRPAAAAPAPTEPPATLGLFDRLANHLVGIGVASAARP